MAAFPPRRKAIAQAVGRTRSLPYRQGSPGIPRGQSPTTRLGIERADAFFELFSRDQSIHALKEYLPPGLALLALVFQVGKCWLIYRVFTPNISVFHVP